MEDRLANPVFNALTSTDAHMASGTGQVRYFDAEVSPFAGFPETHAGGFDDLHAQLPLGRTILFARPSKISEPTGWKIAVEIEGLQFIYQGANELPVSATRPEPLDESHVKEMISLATLTKPGPFGLRTIDFGHYHGIFESGKLVAMTGQRLHVDNYTEISAVCTHPDYLGKGYAANLIIHQLQIISAQGKQAFLHVRADNARAIALYERLGFVISRKMNFYFMKSC